MSDVQQPLGVAIDKLADAMRHMPQWDAEKYTQHHFADGMYMRTLWRPAGTVIVGKVHKKEHLFILAQGEMSIWTHGGMKRIAAPYTMVSPPGTKRVTFAHVDSMGITVHRTDARELADIEADLVEADEKALFGPGNVLLDRLIEVKS